MHTENSPHQPIDLTVHTLPASSIEDPARTRLGRLKLLLVLLVCASPVIASYLTYFFVRPDGRTNYAALIQPSRTVPAMPLQTVEGLPLAELPGRNQWRLIVVGPAACAGECEDRLFMQRQLREMMGRERDRMDKIWLITDEQPVPTAVLDALRGTPSMHLVRAPRAAVESWLEPEAGQILENHLYLVDPMGEWMMRTPVPTEPAKFKRDLERLLKASSFWDQPNTPR